MTTITLNYPINTPNGELKEITLRRAKAKDLRQAQQYQDPAEQEFYLFSALTGVMVEDLEELDLSDYKKLQDEFNAMLTGKPTT